MESASATISSDPISLRFARLRQEGRKALVCYVTAGHPTPEASERLLRGIEAAGADIIEIGVPFSDPLADGPIIQRSSQIALQFGFGFDRTLELVKAARLNVPVVLMTYLNPLIAGGPDAMRRAFASGVHGLIVTDLPVGADPEREGMFSEGPLAYVRLVAPTTPLERMRHIAGGQPATQDSHLSTADSRLPTAPRGFVYLISRLGVTGEQNKLAEELPATIARLRMATDLPICVGFGISTPQQAREVGRLADGVVVGSAIVRAAHDEGVDAAVARVAALRVALDTD